MRYLALFLILGCTKFSSYEVLKQRTPSSFKEILDRHGELIHETRTNFKTHRRSWTDLNDIPPELLKEVLLFEDQRFYSHYGVDLLAITKAISEYPKRGASTITMQLVGLLQNDYQRRSFIRKTVQMKDALLLESSWTKDQILESWLNLVSFRRDIQGIRAASFSLFRKSPAGLNQNERLLLYALIPSPNQSTTKLLDRACRYARRLNRDCSGLDAALASSQIAYPDVSLHEYKAPHVAQRLSLIKADKIQTTIDKDLQLKSIELLQSHLRNLRVQNVQDGAILVMEKRTGNVLSYVGSSGEFSKAPLVDHVQSLRQAGSTLKPFLYAAAISEKLITMTTPLRDEPYAVTREGLTYQPENYQKSFTFQDIQAKVALGSSLNIPAVRVIDYLTPERFYDLLSNLEFRNLYSSDYYGHSMALGAVDITLWDLVKAYRALSTGNLIEPRMTLSDSIHLKEIKTFTPEVQFIISQILSEKNNRTLTFGIQSTLSTDSWSAVKTGTSKDMRDNWCVGFTDKYIIGVWIGNSEGTPMWNVTGISGAAPIFSQLVSILHREFASKPPSIPSTVVQIGDDFYLSGTEPKNKKVQLVEVESVAKITFPQNGAQFAYDPEIPKKNQRILFQASGQNVKWKINGIDSEDYLTPTKKGKYNLQLLDETGKVKDEVSFWVKAGKTI